jgi:hypothetical protein
MRKAAILLIFTILLLTSCSNDSRSSLEIVQSFKSECGIEGRVYSTLFKESDDGYIDSDMEKTLFLDKRVNIEYSIFMRSSLDSVFELCVFKTDSATDMLDAENIAAERLTLLSGFACDGESFIYKKGEILAYGFFPDAKTARELFERVV